MWEFCKNNMAAPAESTEVKAFEDDISSSDSTVMTLSTFTIDFGGERNGPSLQDAFLQYKMKRQVCKSPSEGFTWFVSAVSLDLEI